MQKYQANFKSQIFKYFMFVEVLFEFLNLVLKVEKIWNTNIKESEFVARLR